MHKTEARVSARAELTDQLFRPCSRAGFCLYCIILKFALKSQRKTAFEAASVAIYEKSSNEINYELTKYCNLEFALEIPN